VPDRFQARPGEERVLPARAASVPVVENEDILYLVTGDLGHLDAEALVLAAEATNDMPAPLDEKRALDRREIRATLGRVHRGREPAT
jgi:hypothetical protein